jgi:hypothetical protein
MSALARFADSGRTFHQGREVPIRDLSKCSKLLLLDHLVSAKYKPGWNLVADRL